MIVRGKRSRQGTKPKVASSPSTRPKPGQPMKRASDLAPSRRLKAQQAKQIWIQKTSEMAKMTAALSKIEQLPIEILETIFFASAEVNLVRASPYLSQIFSRESVYKALILSAYFDDDGVHPVEVQHFRPKRYQPLPLRDRIRLQQGILGCRWFTLDRLRSCMPVLSRLKMMQAWHAERETEQGLTLSGESSKNQPVIEMEQILDLGPLPDSNNNLKMEKHFFAKPEGELLLRSDESPPLVGPIGRDEFLPRIREWASWAVDFDGLLYKALKNVASTVCARVIPDWLLTGSPWNDNKVTFLQILWQGFRFLEHDNVLVISAQALFRGMASAIEESKPEILRILLEIHFAAMELDRAVANDDCRQKLAVPFSHPIPLDLFHLAARRGSSGSALLALLIREDIDSIPRDDRILTRWAVRAKADGDALGRWLLTYMENTLDHSVKYQGPLFTNGLLDWRRSKRFAYPPFEHSDFTFEIGYTCVIGGFRTPTNPDGGPCG